MFKQIKQIIKFFFFLKYIYRYQFRQKSKRKLIILISFVGYQINFNTDKSKILKPLIIDEEQNRSQKYKQYIPKHSYSKYDVFQKNPIIKNQNVGNILHL